MSSYLNVYLKMDIQYVRSILNNSNESASYSNIYFDSSLAFIDANNVFTIITNEYISPNSQENIVCSYVADSGTKYDSLQRSDSKIINNVLEARFSGINTKFFLGSNSYIYMTLTYRFTFQYLSNDFSTSLFNNLNGGSFTLKIDVGGY